MPQESNQNQSNSLFISPVKNLRGLKGNLGYNSSSNEVSYTEEMFNDRDLAQRKAEEAGTLILFFYNNSVQTRYSRRIVSRYQIILSIIDK